MTFDVERAVREIKAGKIEFRVDKTGNVHAPIGKVSFSPDQLEENLSAFMENILRAKPSRGEGAVRPGSDGVEHHGARCPGRRQPLPPGLSR